MNLVMFVICSSKHGIVLADLTLNRIFRWKSCHQKQCKFSENIMFKKLNCIIRPLFSFKQTRLARAYALLLTSDLFLTIVISY